LSCGGADESGVQATRETGSAASGGNTSGGTTNASSKATAAINTITVCETGQGGTPCVVNQEGVWQDVMSAGLKTSNVTDLFVTASMVTGGVSVRVLLDGDPTKGYPDSAGGGTAGTGCTLTVEQITLALQTTSAHSFGWILPNVGTGSHTITVQAQLNTQAFGTNGGTAVADALYGLGSLTVEGVRLVNSFSF
jgi:hypothetical protein